jgi:hypothetical protein
VLAAATRIAVWTFAVVVAVSQLGVATALINTLVVGVVGAVALAVGLAFGLGGRARAADLLDRFERSATPSPAAAAIVSTTAPAVAMEDPAATTATPRPVVFEEGWTPRSGLDRRRMARPGADRRVVTA